MESFFLSSVDFEIVLVLIICVMRQIHESPNFVRGNLIYLITSQFSGFFLASKGHGRTVSLVIRPDEGSRRNSRANFRFFRNDS